MHKLKKTRTKAIKKTKKSIVSIHQILLFPIFREERKKYTEMKLLHHDYSDQNNQLSVLKCAEIVQKISSKMHFFVCIKLKIYTYKSLNTNRLYPDQSTVINLGFSDN